MSAATDQLVLQAQAGNYPAASELVARFYQRIFAYLRRLTGSDDDAADLTQRAFAKAWTSLPSYAGKSSFVTWLHGIARHVFLDWLREKNPVEPQSDDWWEAQASTDASPSDDVAARDLANHLFALVDQLEANARHTVHLHYYQGLSIAETAEVMHVATSTVKHRLRQALDLLRNRTGHLQTK